MKIGIDISWMPTNGRMDGLHRYTKILVDKVSSQNSGVYMLGKANYQSRRQMLGFANFFLSHQVKLPYELLSTPLDVIHYPGNIGAILDVFPNHSRVVTVHDIMFLSSSRRRVDGYYRHVFHTTIKRMSGVMFVSDQTMGQFKETFPSLDIPMQVICNPVSDIFRVDSGWPKSLPLGTKYILAQGSTMKRKNLTGILDAYQNFRRDSAFKDVYLVLYGGDMDAKRISGQFVGTRYIEFPDDDELAKLYSHALCTWVLSLDEGFGLPAAEALTCGSPVIASNVGGLPFVVGNQGGLVTPTDIDQIVQFTKRHISDNCAESVENRRIYADRFSTQQFVKNVLQFYQVVMSR